uniref:indole-3-glycerol-phosphate synthase n=1 Tax=Setaria viridis TaxID=4556 RepID=A0A4U6VB16_SETVI|nr:hypothetical protein SEVIR_4G182500v2 [Setaria viridis]
MAILWDVLEQVVWDKEVEVSQRKARAPLQRGHCLGCHNGGLPALVVEVEITQAYEKNGAACLSILTDEKHFLGSFKNMKTIHYSGVNFPLLCKDFIIDIWQIYYARSKGADAILLIAAVLPDLDIKYMLRVCRSLGMTALVEIDGVQPIGINNCSLGTFEVDTTNTNMLLEKRGDIIRKKKIMKFLKMSAVHPCPAGLAVRLPATPSPSTGRSHRHGIHVRCRPQAK